MKKCTDCGFENSNNATLCESCFSPLGEISDITSEEFFEEYERKERRKERRKELINYGILGVYGVVVLVFFIMGIVSSLAFPVLITELIVSVICGVVYYLSLFHSDLLFKMSNIHMIYNIDDVQPSDWYYTSTAFGGYLALITGVALAVVIHFDITL